MRKSGYKKQTIAAIKSFHGKMIAEFMELKGWNEYIIMQKGTERPTRRGEEEEE